MNENENASIVGHDQHPDWDDREVTEVAVERFAPGTKVQVAADAKTADGSAVYFDGEIIGEVVMFADGDYLVRGPVEGDPMAEQFVAAEFLTEVIVVTEPADLLGDMFAKEQLTRLAIVQDLLNRTLSGNLFGGKALSWDASVAVIRLATYIEEGADAALLLPVE